MNIIDANHHEFAIYYENLSALINQYSLGADIFLKSSDLYYRLVTVLRLKPQDMCILFNRDYHIKVAFKSIFKKEEIVLQLLERQENKILKPEIVFYLPLLKREALEESVYSLVELGANGIQLINTEKVQRKWGGTKEFDRLSKIMIAAAEQSKNFKFPVLHEPISLQEINFTCPTIFFDIHGDNVLNSIKKLSKEQKISLLIGPEGDLTSQEKQWLIDQGVIFCALTPTILRARQAVVVALGIYRSLL